MARYKLCHAAEQAAEGHQMDVELDRKAALADTCQENAR
jgi:hypothetical protein